MAESSELKFVRGNQDVDTSFLALEMVWAGFRDRRITRQTGTAVPKSFLEIINGRTINYFVEKGEFNNLIDRSARVVLEDKNLLKQLKEKTDSISSELRSYALELLGKVQDFGDRGMADALLQIRNLQIESSLFGVAIAWADVHGGMTNKLLGIISKKQGLKYSPHTYLNVLGTPREKSLTEKAYDDIASERKTDKELLNDYFWLNQGYIGRGLTQEELDSIKKQDRGADANITESELAQELNLSEEEKQLFDIYQDIIFCKSLRADSRQFLYVAMNRIVDVLSKKWKVESKYVEAMPAEEIIGILLEGKSFPPDIQERSDHSVVELDSNGSYVYRSGEQANELVISRLVHENSSIDDVLRGHVAYPGHIKGKVKLLFGPQHNDKVGEGDILVSTSTSPQLLPAMKLASAFITDVGGITSHAAIVARELKKPCIVGTKCATQIFKDGDLVEVDANEGTIRSING